jgi:hypothetical protein
VKLFGHGKLRSKWEGSFKVISTSSHGALTLQNDEGTLFKVNGHRLKIFLEPSKGPEEVDIIEFIIFPSYGPNPPSFVLWFGNKFVGAKIELEVTTKKGHVSQL